MLAFLPSIAFQAPLPPSAWRGDTGFRHDDQTSAAQVVAYEQRQGRLLDLSPELVAILAGLHASALLWVTFKRSLAARYGPPARVALDLPAYLIGEDGVGGYLILFPDNPTGSQTENATMKAPAEATARELKEAGELFAANMNAQQTDAKAEIGGYIVLERSTQDKGDASKLAGHYPDQRDAVTHARLYPATAEHARESGQNAWAEVHPVTKGFYDAITQDPAQGDRLSSMAALYSHAREIEGGAIIPASPNETRATTEKGPMNDTPDERRAAFMAELEIDRKADLDKRLDALQQDAEAIVTDRGNSAAGHYQQHRANFDATQGELEKRINRYSRDAELNEMAFPHETAKIADSNTQAATLASEKEARGHEYAAFLAERVGAYKQSVGQEDTAVALFKEAAARREIAGIVRDGSEPERPTDPDKSTGRDGGRANLDSAEGGKYDTLRQSETDARALTQQRELAASKGETVGVDSSHVQQRAPEPDAEDEKAKRGRAEGGGGDEKIPTEARLSANVRVDVQETPRGTATVSTVKNSDPLPEEVLEPRQQTEREAAELMQPVRPEERQAAERAQPQHPDAHEPPAVEAADPAARQSGPEVTARQESEASTKRQEAEQRDAAGEAQPADTGKPLTYGERRDAERAAVRAEVEAESQSREAEPTRAATASRGMM